MPARLVAGCTLAAMVLAVCLGQPQASPPIAMRAEDQSRRLPERLAARHLPNVYRIHLRVISGGQPQGEAGFRELATLGVKTVISVDGATPDVATAKRHGLRYVHLPHGYDGISDERVQQLAKAVRDLPGPIYIHCHHGKHRSPAASAVACVAAGLIEPSGAVSVLEAAGTSAGYRGLYASARDARPLDVRLLDALRPEFPETAKIPPLAEAMVAVEQSHDRLKAVAAVGWRTPPDHPDLEPAHEALLLREHFTELLRSDPVQKEPAGFRKMLEDSEAGALDLEKRLAARNVAGYAAEAEPAIAAAFARIEANCAACHRTYRDVPLSEKAKP